MHSSHTMTHIRYTKEIIQEAVNRSFCWAEACRQLNLQPSSGSQSYLKKRAMDFKVSFGHFWSISKLSARPKKTLRKDIRSFLISNGPFINSHALKVRLIRDGLKRHACESCGITRWMDRPTPLELHHVNGVKNDNRIENIQILCPNCHAMTPNHAGRKLKQLIPA